MKTLTIILQSYLNHEYGLIKMAEVVNIYGLYMCCKNENGKMHLKAKIGNEVIEVTL